MRFTRPIIICWLTALAGCGGAWQLTGPVRVWAVPEWGTVFPDAGPELENEVFSDAANTVRLEAAVNETVSFQLVFSSGRERGVVAEITRAPLRQGERTIPADQIQLYRELRVPVSDYPAWYLRLTPFTGRPREFPDPLVPLGASKGGLPIRLEPERSEAVWGDVHVPAGTEPGIYRGAITVVTGAGARRELEVALTVWAFALPQTRHLPVLAGIDTTTLLRHHLEVDGRPYAPARLRFDDPLYERATTIVDETARLLHEHRCCPVLLGVHPVRRVGAGGQLELDWTDYDRLVGGTVSGSAFDDRVGSPAWPMPVDQHEPAPDAYGGWGSPKYGEFLREYLKQCAAHFAERGWLDRHFVWIEPPGPGRGDGYRQFAWLGQLARQIDPRLRLVCPLTSQSMGPYGWVNDPFTAVSEYVAVWCPPAELADARELARQRAAGKPAWLRPGCPPYSGSLSLIAPSEHARSIGWQAYRYDYDAVWLPRVNRWGEDGTPSAMGSEEALVWPGAAYGLGGPVPSIRLKRLLRGLEDYEYLWLLAQNRRPAIARTIVSDLFRRGGTDCYGEHFLDGRAQGWVADPRAWSLARRLAGREIMAALEAAAGGADESPPAQVNRFEQQIDWARLTEAVRQIRVEIEGVRVHFDLADAATPVVVEATVSVFNATRAAVNATVELTEAANDWVVRPPPAPIAGLESAAQTRRVIEARAPGLQPRTEGIVPIRVAVRCKEGEPIRAEGRLCALTSQRLTRPVTIDGNLSDWPLAPQVASDFVLVGAGDVPKQDLPAPDRASQLTTVFVGDDAEYLYIAFNCQENDLANRRITRSNYVRYDDLWPVGEDLIEIILDPTGQAAGPGELLHIVVKANGAVITERGIACLDRVAPHGKWIADVTAAIDDTSQPDRWTVEIRIPLSGLGERGEVWGVNFARFDARRGEYASWAPARSNLYSPLTLGNLLLRRP